MNERPRVLDALGSELERAARANLAASGRLRLAPRRLSFAVLVLLGLALLAAAAAAAALLIAQGAPLPAPHAQDLQSSGVPLPGSARLAGLDAPDPNPEAPPWDIRLSRTAAGETCTAVGEIVAGHLGIVGLDHVFRALPLGGVDACGIASPHGPLLAGARVFVGATPAQARTVVNGVAGPGARSVTALGPGGPRTLRLGPDGSFITVYRGYVEEVRPSIVVVDRSGQRHTISFAASSAFEVADPAGGSPWEANGGADLQAGAYPEENCAQVVEQVGRTDPSREEAAMTPTVCGRLGIHPLFVSMRRFVPGEGSRTGTPWGNNPSRTLVYGVASPRVALLTLTGAGPTRTLAIDPHNGLFLAVLDGHIDPRTLTLTAHLRGGGLHTYTHSTNLLSGRRPQPEPPVPAYRNPLPRAAAEPPPPDIVLKSTLRETLQAADPAGGPPWALRSWRALPNPRADFGANSKPSSFLCTQTGVLSHHRLLQPRTGLPLSAGADYGLDGGCNSPSDLARLGPLAQTVTDVANPFAYAPRPLRTVVSGLLPLRATDPLLLGAGAPRPLAVDANHAFLAVLPGRFWDAPLRISVRVGVRTIVRSAVEGPGGAAPSVPQARAPDPGGGAPFGFAATGSAAAIGRIVDGRLATIEPRLATLHAGPSSWSSGGCTSCGTPRHPLPVRFDTSGGSEASLPGEPSTGPLPPEVQRRTLPGTTIVTGIALSSVVSVTLRTPRDVRTLRPSGPLHVFIAVYDGQFFRGTLSATVLLRSGRTVTEPVPPGPGGLISSFLPAPTPLSVQLRRDERTLRGMRAGVARALRVHGATARARALGGASFGMFVTGLRQLRRVVALERVRLGYLRGHPGVLPGE